jgi:putative transcriptional regulator
MSRVGKFLIARPTAELGCFKQSVVFIYEDSNNGVAGVTITVPSPKKLNDVVSVLGVDTSPGDHVIYNGGPVATHTLMMIHSDDFSSTNTLHTGSGIDVSSDTLMVEKLLMGNEPLQYRLVSGYCAWKAGQLEREIELGCWLLAELNTSIVFGKAGINQWNAAVDSAGSAMIDKYL